MDLIFIIVPVLGVILFPSLIIFCAKRQQDKDKARGGNVEIGSGSHGLKDGNMVVLAGAGEDAVSVGSAAATVVDSGDRDKGVEVLDQQLEPALLQMLIDCCCSGGDCCGGSDDGGGCGGCGD